MSVGIETGNEFLRRKVLNRQISNEQIKKAFSIIKEYEIRVSTFNLIGIPFETRENVYETIRLNREIGTKAANVYIVYPFPETAIAKENKVKITDEKGRIIPMSRAADFEFSTMKKEELIGLRKTFNLYLDLPEELWPIIRLAEKENEIGKTIFDSLVNFTETTIE